MKKIIIASIIGGTIGAVLDTLSNPKQNEPNKTVEKFTEDFDDTDYVNEVPNKFAHSDLKVKVPTFEHIIFPKTQNARITFATNISPILHKGKKLLDTVVDQVDNNGCTIDDKIAKFIVEDNMLRSLAIALSAKNILLVSPDTKVQNRLTEWAAITTETQTKNPKVSFISNVLEKPKNYVLIHNALLNKQLYLISSDPNNFLTDPFELLYGYKEDTGWRSPVDIYLNNFDDKDSTIPPLEVTPEQFYSKPEKPMSPNAQKFDEEMSRGNITNAPSFNTRKTSTIKTEDIK